MEASKSVETYAAGCACGSFRFEMTGNPVAVVVCHCTTCRAHSGAPYLHTAAWPIPQVKRIKGKDEDILKFVLSEAVGRHSCKECGGPIANVIEQHGIIGFHLGTIEDAFEGNTYKPVFRPQCHLFYGSRVVDIKDGSPKMKKKAPEDGMLDE